MRCTITIALVWAALATVTVAQEQFNYDEAKVPKFELPDPLVTEAGERVTTADQWRQTRRPELFRLFEEQVYGRSPAAPEKLRFKVTSPDAEVFGGKGLRREVTVYFDERADTPSMSLLIYRPKSERPVPAFLGLNFGGNHTISDDPAITLNSGWMRNRPDRGVTENAASEASRGTASSRWPVEMIVGRGYALVTAYYGDIDPDFDDGFQNGIHPLFCRAGETKPAADEWGASPPGLGDSPEHSTTSNRRRISMRGRSR
ncbi:MAG: hypothetical protein R3B90_18555 [Planctomycetaceae bacterium]